MEKGTFNSEFPFKIPKTTMLKSMGQMLNHLLVIKKATIRLQADNSPTLQQVFPTLILLCKNSKKTPTGSKARPQECLLSCLKKTQA
jgi:hypothetical protein